uniref:Photosynthetic NDH subunit of lumenal location 1ic n=1 Tax=Rhizophora mucronata TaxID=61149 RepID=A0A2P2LJN0_RHIMU
MRSKIELYSLESTMAVSSISLSWLPTTLSRNVCLRFLYAFQYPSTLAHAHTNTIPLSHFVCSFRTLVIYVKVLLFPVKCPSLERIALCHSVTLQQFCQLDYRAKLPKRKLGISSYLLLLC